MRPAGTVRRADFFGNGSVSKALRCGPVTSRILLRELHRAGVQGVYVVDNGMHVCDRAGLQAAAAEYSRRTEPRQPKKSGGIVSR